MPASTVRPLERLLESLETDGAAGFDEAYLAELKQRSADVDSGAVELIPIAVAHQSRRPGYWTGRR